MDSQEVSTVPVDGPIFLQAMERKSSQVSDYGLEQEDDTSQYMHQFELENNPLMTQESPITQLTTRIIQLQCLFKTLDLIQFYQFKRLAQENAFQKLKLNSLQIQIKNQKSAPPLLDHQQQQPPLLSLNAQPASALELNSNYRSDQIRQILLEDHISSPTRLQYTQQQDQIQMKQINTQELLSSFQDLEQRLHKEEESKSKNSSISELALTKIHTLVEEMERMRTYLNQKIETVEQMELEALEEHLRTEQRLKQSEEYRKFLIKNTNAEVQTDLNYQELIETEKSVEIKVNELEISKFKEKQGIDQRDRNLLRRERDLDIRERLTEEKRMEYTFKQRELNQRLKSAISWPLNCLENEERLGEKIRDIKLTPDLFKGLTLESDQSFAEFKERDSNQKLLRSYQGELYAKAEALLKYEYCILQERARNDIVKDYMESELGKIEQERMDLSQEREKYAFNSEKERQIQEDKKYIEQQRTEIQSLLENMRKSQLNQENQLYMLGNSSNLNLSQTPPLFQLHQIISNQQQHHHSREPSSNFLQTLAKIDFPFSLRNHFNSVSLSKSPNPGAIGFSLLNQSVEAKGLNQYPTLAEKIEKTLQDFEKLNESYFPRNQSDLLNKKEENIEALKKVLLREAYFIDEEKRYLNEKRSQVFNASKINNKGDNLDVSSLSHSGIQEDSKIAYNQDDEKRKLRQMQDNLELEKERNQSMKEQLQQDIRQASIENHKLLEAEKKMNEEKLKMLIKFEKIKQLEDFYNKHNREQPISLELEVSQEEIDHLLLKMLRKKSKPQKSFQEQKELQIKSLVHMFTYHMHRNLKQNKNNQNFLKEQFLVYWKGETLIKRNEQDRLRQILRCLDNESLVQMGLKPQFKREFMGSVPVMDWFDTFWLKKSKELSIETFNKMSAEQLYVAASALKSDLEKFWKFRCQNTLKLVNLHMKRRARLLVAFAFQQYKYQTQKQKVSFILQIKENAFKGSSNSSIEGTSSYHNKQLNIFKSNVGQGVFNIKGSDFNDSQQLYEDRVHYLEGGNSTGQEGLGSIHETDGEDHEFNQVITIGTPKLAMDSHLVTMGTNEVQRAVLQINTNQFNNRMNTQETHQSQTYTGISEIIMNQNLQNIKRNAILTYLLMRKNSTESSRLKAQGLNRWKNFIRDLEMLSIKPELKRVVGEVENLKFQEQLLRTSFRLQKTELESKISELITFCLGSSANQSSTHQQQSNGAQLLTY